MTPFVSALTQNRVGVREIAQRYSVVLAPLDVHAPLDAHTLLDVLALLDEQAPRKEGSISKRSELAQFLGVRLPPGPAVGSRRRIPVPGTR